jgi:hypothetical protein
MESPMVLLSFLAVLMIAVVLVDAFEAMIFPRRVNHAFRPARLFYRSTWTLWHWCACFLRSPRRQQTFLSVYGPLSLLALFAVWAVGLIVGFALLHWSLDTPVHLPEGGQKDFVTFLYFSGTTFFTLGYGEVTPTEGLGRALSVGEAGLGFAFLAVMISYLPVLYQAFSRREITISLLDARAGSPPTAAELLTRLGRARSSAALGPMLTEWERWSAELLESHLSYPVLSYYRSQHDNQSWVSTLTLILDTSALLIAGVDGADVYQARLTFAMARHAAVDLGMVFGTKPIAPSNDRLPTDLLRQMRTQLAGAGLPLHEGPAVEQALTELRALYEPFVNALGERFLFPLPAFLPEKPPVDNWQTSAWMRRSPGLGALPSPDDQHFD